jgi:hypothetical protein
MRIWALVATLALAASFPAERVAAAASADLTPPLGSSRPRRTAVPSLDPNLYENSLGTMVIYDDQLNQREYDDGYAPSAHVPFEAALAHYGTWVDTPELGRVWIPARSETGRDFAPYRTNGHWVFTEFGWTWSSNWSWGWAPFHYGRWTFLAARGWCWIPGTLWGPAWVAWRASRTYVAWAPLPPKGIELGRPLGTRSPWSMVRARAPSSSNAVPGREVPALFSLTAAISNPRALSVGPFTYRINIGPTPGRCCGSVSGKISDAHATPKVFIRPRHGIALPQRPWMRRAFHQQTPICPWPPFGGPEEDTCPETLPSSHVAAAGGHGDVSVAR